MDKVYDYDTLTADIEKICRRYPFIEITTAGRSREGRELYVLRLGRGERSVFYNGSHHALEWITSELLMRFVFDYAKSYIRGRRLNGSDIRRLYDTVTFYIMPMVNPDGIEIAKEIPCWQANSMGVDLNHNYDAGWYEYRDIAANRGIIAPCSTRYPGAHPECEPESRAVADFTRNTDFEYVVAFHSQGKVIYWRYGGLEPPGAERIAALLSEASGYALDETEGLASYSGYKDWFIKEFNRPGFTVEVGEGTNPLPLSQFCEIYGDIIGLLLAAEEI